MKIKHLKTGMPLRLVSSLVCIGAALATAICLLASWTTAFVVFVAVTLVWSVAYVIIMTTEQHHAPLTTSVDQSFRFFLLSLSIHLGYLVVTPYVVVSITWAVVWYHQL